MALSDSQIEKELTKLDGWTHEDDQLVKTYTFGSFKEAVGFIVRVSFEAEEMNHHPELTNVYDRVTIRLTTHDAGGKVTERDFRLAEKIEAISWV